MTRLSSVEWCYCACLALAHDMRVTSRIGAFGGEAEVPPPRTNHKPAISEAHNSGRPKKPNSQPQAANGHPKLSAKPITARANLVLLLLPRRKGKRPQTPALCIRVNRHPSSRPPSPPSPIRFLVLAGGRILSINSHDGVPLYRFPPVPALRGQACRPCCARSELHGHPIRQRFRYLHEPLQGR